LASDLHISDLKIITKLKIYKWTTIIKWKFIVKINVSLETDDIHAK
jgi:hypothetical protein